MLQQTLSRHSQAVCASVSIEMFKADLAEVFLVVSECSLFRGYFARNWPLLSPSHGFVTLGVAMIVLGLNMLGNMNKEATSKESLGLPFWRLLVASGILALIIGTFNIIAVSQMNPALLSPYETNIDVELRLPRLLARHHGSSCPLPWRNITRFQPGSRTRRQTTLHHHPPHRLLQLPNRHRPPIHIRLSRQRDLALPTLHLLPGAHLPQHASIHPTLVPQPGRP